MGNDLVAKLARMLCWMLLLLWNSGCDSLRSEYVESLRSKVIEQKSWGIIYDTKYEATLNSGKSTAAARRSMAGLRRGSSRTGGDHRL